MTDVMQGLVTEAKKNRFSTIDLSLSDDDVASVWDNVAVFIEKQMAQQKGVNVTGLGIFTFTQKKLDVGNNKFILIQRPVFLLSEKLAQTHGLQYTKHHVTGQIPVVQLNFAALSFETPFDRDSVEACVKEVLLALSRSLAAKRNVEFTFNGIGRLQIRDARVKMKFFKEYINGMDGSGRLLMSMKDRPGTVDSVMSDRSPTGMHTRNTLVLPRINQGLDSGMPTIQEDEPFTVEQEPAELEYKPTDDQGDRDESELGKFELDGETEDVDEPKRTSRLGSRASMTMAQAAGISFQDDLLPNRIPSPKGLRGMSALSARPGQSPLSPKRTLSPINAFTGGSPTQDFLRSRSVDGLSFKRPSPVNFAASKTPTPPSGDRPHTSGSACGHANAGQELCYLCHQRERRNVPVSFTEERQQREQEEDRLLQQFQHAKDTDELMKHQDTLLAKRHESQMMAAFNLGASQAIKAKKLERDTDFHPSYVFQRRALTPPKFIKQDKYSTELAEQVSQKEDAEKQRRSDEAFLERLEQAQMAEDLAAQRERFLKDKTEQQEQYKRALSAQINVRDKLRSPSDMSRPRVAQRLGPLTLPRPQIILPFSQSYDMKIEEGSGPNKRVVRFKPAPIAARVPDASEPVFGKNDVTNDKMAERRRRAHEVYKEQLQTVEQRKRDAILKRLQDQREEDDMLRRTKRELLEDRADRYVRLVNRRKDLETDWSSAVLVKRQNEHDERDHAKSAGMLLHEQCDIYRRCGQCKRRVNNCGESNIWRESRYIPGSRLMV